MNTHNPYSPPRAPVADIPQADPSRWSPELLVALGAITVAFPFLWQAVSGGRLRFGPYLGLFLADLTLLILITRYAFALRARGVLR